MRKEIEGRPLIAIAAALMLGLSALLHPLNVLLAIPLFLLWPSLPTRIAVAASLLIGVLLGPRPAAQLDSPQIINEAVTVQSVPRIYPDQIGFEGSLSNGNTISVYLQGRPDVAYGAAVQITGLAKPLDLQAQKYLAIRGISGTIHPTFFRITSPGAAPSRWAERWRSSFDSFSHTALATPLASVASALCFNMDRLLDEDTENALRRTGTVHIVSVSGLHVVVLAVSLLWFLSKVPVPRGVQLLIAALALSFYALATGLNPPTLRAVLMALIGFAAYLFRRDTDWLSALTATAVIYLLIRPHAIYDIGFQLSFATVGAFCLFLSPNREVPDSPLLHWGRLALETARAGLVASLFSAPLVAYHFGQISLVAVIANLLIAIVVPSIIIGSFLSHLLWLAWPVVGIFSMHWLVGSWIGFLDVVVDSMSSPSWAVLPIPEFNGYLLLPLYVAMLMTWRVNVRRP